MDQLKGEIAICIGGWDPCGGAGLAADIKTFEALGVTGMGVCSAITVQTEDQFHSVKWTESSLILEQLNGLLNRYQPKVIKIGIIERIEVLIDVISIIDSIPIIWDPILKASSGFQFQDSIDKTVLNNILKQILLLTPNRNEANQLLGDVDDISALQNMINRNQWGSLLIKGGHASDHANDILIRSHQIETFCGQRFDNPGKHGSGCVLSAAISSFIAKGYPLIDSCRQAKKYVEQFILSSQSLLGRHFEINNNN